MKTKIRTEVKGEVTIKTGARARATNEIRVEAKAKARKAASVRAAAQKVRAVALGARVKAVDHRIAVLIRVLLNLYRRVVKGIKGINELRFSKKIRIRIKK